MDRGDSVRSVETTLRNFPVGLINKIEGKRRFPLTWALLPAISDVMEETVSSEYDDMGGGISLSEDVSRNSCIPQ